jgi:hypothetical protein
MKFRRLSLGAGLLVPALLALTGIGAGAEADAHTAAVKACTGQWASASEIRDRDR